MSAIRLLLYAEHLLVFQSKHVPLLELKIFSRDKGRLWVSSNYLSILQLYDQDNEWYVVNVSVEGFSVFLIKPVKGFGWADSSFDVVFKTGNKPFKVVTSWVVEDVTIEVLKVFTMSVI